MPIRAYARGLGATLNPGESLTHTVGDRRHAYLAAATGRALDGGQTITFTAIDDTEIVLADAE